jgi:hypothetical protein
MLGNPRRQISQAAREFINCDVGCGLFVGECDDNLLCVHQGANEGYRALFVACFKGPSAGAVVVVLGSGDAEIVPLLCNVARRALLQLGLFSKSHIDKFVASVFSASPFIFLHPG